MDGRPIAYDPSIRPIGTPAVNLAQAAAAAGTTSERCPETPSGGGAIQPTKQRTNEQIRISPVRVVAADGTMLGEMPTDDARRLAAEAGMDLVEVGADSRPPVCRIMDLGKVRFEKKKKPAAVRQQQLKQIRLRAKTGAHDIDFKVRQARSFLERKDKVKINVIFRGRENAHHDRGREMLEGIIGSLGDIATVERPPSMDSGKMMATTLIPKKT